MKFSNPKRLNETKALDERTLVFTGLGFNSLWENTLIHWFESTSHLFPLSSTAPLF